MRPAARMTVAALTAAVALGGCAQSPSAAPPTRAVADQGDTGPAPRQLLDLPAPGTVTVVPGPFSDRLRLTETHLTGSSVVARLRVTSDVSELIDLELSAAFYDAAGHLLGTGRAVYAEGDGGTGKPAAENAGVVLTVVWKGPGKPVSARLSVPTLVNE